MTAEGRSPTILLADDDEDDRLLVQDALAESRVASDLRSVRDGDELMAYLERREGYADPAVSPRPDLILLDLNMPKKDGPEALREIRAKAHLRQIPIVVLTTSRAGADVDRSYDLGANSFVSKPATFAGLVEAMRIVMRSWLQTGDPPPDKI